MARSNRTLSGCFESTFAIGLLTFLFVHATVTASTPKSSITGIRRDIRILKTSARYLRLYKTAAIPSAKLLQLPPSTIFARYLLDRLYRTQRCPRPEFRRLPSPLPRLYPKRCRRQPQSDS